MKVFKPTLKRLSQSLIPVFKPLTLYFGIYYFALFFILEFIKISLAGGGSLIFIIIGITISILAGLCPPFLVPYYAFRHERPSAAFCSFKAFVWKAIWPLFLNSVLAGLVVILYAVPIISLLIGHLIFKWPIPVPLQLVLYPLFTLMPVYKGIKYLFVNCVVFFDEAYKNRELSALKASHRVTEGCFWPFMGSLFVLLLLLLVLYTTSGLLPLFLAFDFETPESTGAFFEKFSDSLTGKPPETGDGTGGGNTSSLFGSMLNCITGFYSSSLYMLFLSQFYFEVKKQKEEPISY